MVVEPEDDDMADVPEIPPHGRKQKVKGKRRSSAALIEEPAPGLKRTLQDSPSRVEPVAKRSRSTRGTAASSSPALLVPLGSEVMEDDMVNLDAIPALIGQVCVDRYRWFLHLTLSLVLCELSQGQEGMCADLVPEPELQTHSLRVLSGTPVRLLPW